MEAFQQVITIPLLSNIDSSELLDIAQELLEELQDRIEDAGFRVEIDEGEVSVEQA
jgi:hypothetical protein